MSEPEDDGPAPDGSKEAKDDGNDPEEGEDEGEQKETEDGRKKKKEMRKKVQDTVGEGRVSMDDMVLKAMVKEAVDDLLTREVLVRDPETGNIDLREVVDRKKGFKKEKEDDDKERVEGVDKKDGKKAPPEDENGKK